MPKSQEPTPKRGRPRAYDPAAALDRITDTFWAGGFAGVSLDELAAATGMNRPSLYAAFGDKKAMYRSAIRNFRGRMLEKLGRDVPRDADIRTVLRGVLRGALDLYAADGPRGCMALCTIQAEAATDPDIRGDLAALVDAMDAAYRRRFERARKAGELPKNADPAALGRIAAAVQQSLAVRARAGQSPAALKRMIDDAVDVILGKA